MAYLCVSVRDGAGILLRAAACAGAVSCSPQSAGESEGQRGQTVVAQEQTVDGANSGPVAGAVAPYPLLASPGTWVGEQKLPNTGDGADQTGGRKFGWGVALSGDTALVGGRYSDVGVAFVFVRMATSWTEQQKLSASDGAKNHSFGFGMALDGDTALVGRADDDVRFNSAGAAFIFVRSAATWSEQQKLTAGAGVYFDRFGASASLSGDTALVGSSRSDGVANYAGAAYVFKRVAASWAEQQKLVASDGGADDAFGASVSLSGNVALVGARGADAAGSDSGAAYVFARVAASWTQQQKLVASDAAASAHFGGSVSLSGDVALVGAYGDDDAGSNSGAAYVFVRVATSWTEQQKLIATEPAADDRFGESVSLAGDAALVGARGTGDTGNGPGTAYIFERAAATWAQQQKLGAIDGVTNDAFGASVSFGGDTAIVGAIGSTDTFQPFGSAYVMARRLSDGQSCGNGADCASAFCVDGYCCEGVCDGSCEACDLLGLEGSCTPMPRGSAPDPSCQGYLCNGDGAGCPTSCRGDGECADAHSCRGATACLPKARDGQPCGGDEQCLSGHCAAGICCAEACDDGCGSCQFPGFVGACIPLGKDHPGTPSCAPYACTGSATACPASCTAHSQCSHGNHCAEGACRPDDVLGSSCSDNGTCATGHCTDGICCAADACGAYRCGAAGACEPACSSSAQCASGHECTSAGSCVPLAESSGVATKSGACRVANVSAAPRSLHDWLGGLAILACLGLVRRREPSTEPVGSAGRYDGRS